jgi:hypothetical protein
MRDPKFRSMIHIKSDGSIDVVPVLLSDTVEYVTKAVAAYGGTASVAVRVTRERIAILHMDDTDPEPDPALEQVEIHPDSQMSMVLQLVEGPNGGHGFQLRVTRKHSVEDDAHLVSISR